MKIRIFHPAKRIKIIIKFLDLNADRDHQKNLIDCFLCPTRLALPFQKYHQNITNNIWVILLTERQTNKPKRQKQNLFHEGNYIKLYNSSSDTCPMLNFTLLFSDFFNARRPVLPSSEHILTWTLADVEAFATDPVKTSSRYLTTAYRQHSLHYQ